MKYSDFKMLGAVEMSFGKREFAEITVTKWLGFVSKRRIISRCTHSLYWKFVDTGAFVDWLAIDQLEDAWKAQEDFKKLPA